MARVRLLSLVQQGNNLVTALKIIGRSRSWYDTQRREAPGFATEIDAIRTQNAMLITEARESGIGFSEFSEEYLFAKVWPHMQNGVDLIEGRDPSWLHPSMIYEPGAMGHRRILLNVPPNHAKSMTVTINYVVYRLAMNPNINIMVISKTLPQAKKFLYAIKQRLTHPRYAKMQVKFGPVEGFRAAADSWSSTAIYLGSAAEETGSKDPTVEAVGMGGTIYGNRADLVILDDVVTLSNTGEFESQRDWITQEVSSRLPPDGGQIVVVGTRVAAMDLYKDLRNPDHYADAEVTWTYLAMPALLESHDDPTKWVTLWPKSEVPLSDRDIPDEDGYFDRWTGPRMSRVRNEVGQTKWSLVYQNLDVAENAIFHPTCVRGAVNGLRKSGPLIASAAGHPANPQNFYRVIGLDPAMSGDTAAVAYAVDRRTNRRYVMDVSVITAPTPAAIRTLIYEWSDRYKPNVVIVESNAFQLFLTKDEQIREFLANRGIAYRPHFTGNNKTDPDFGVASLAPLFGSLVEMEGKTKGMKYAGDALIELPATSNESVKKLVEQLITWVPNVRGSKLKMDTVMALWFCETVAREVLFQGAQAQNFYDDEFVSMFDDDARYIIDLDQLQQEQFEDVYQ